MSGLEGPAVGLGARVAIAAATHFFRTSEFDRLCARLAERFEDRVPYTASDYAGWSRTCPLEHTPLPPRRSPQRGGFRVTAATGSWCARGCGPAEGGAGRNCATPGDCPTFPAARGRPGRPRAMRVCSACARCTARDVTSATTT